MLAMKIERVKTAVTEHESRTVLDKKKALIEMWKLGK